jgi:hypothetical protein
LRLSYSNQHGIIAVEKRLGLRYIIRVRITVFTVALLLAVSAGATPTKSASEAEAQLSRVQSRIRAVTEAVQSDVAARDAVAADLHQADQALAAARQRYDEVRGRHASSSTRLAELRNEQGLARSATETARDALAQQLRATYIAGRDDALKALLNNGDPARTGRLLAYYGYLERARTADFDALVNKSQRLAKTEATVSTETAQLADLEQARRKEALALDSARKTRARALAQLQARIANRSVELKELKSNAAALEDLMKRLRAALTESGGDDFGAIGQGRRAFSELRGKLPWPARGSIAARYGETRVGGMTWNGVLLDTHRGAEVRAPYFGRVAYADWLPGLGLLLVLDHGGGWMSLYGYNGQLLRKVGDRVKPGDLIAQSLNDSDVGKAQLYFEIRESARAVDPRTFLKGMPSP